MDDDRDFLIDRIKALQRGSPEGKHSWWTYCKKNGSTDFDPRRHDAKFLTGFLKEWQTASASNSAESTEKNVLVQRVKELQRSSAESKEAWYVWCAQHGSSNYDPARHDEKFLRRFCDAYHSGALGVGPAAGGGRGSPGKGEAWGASSSSAWGGAVGKGGGWGKDGGDEAGAWWGPQWDPSDSSWWGGCDWAGDWDEGGWALGKGGDAASWYGDSSGSWDGSSWDAGGEGPSAMYGKNGMDGKGLKGKFVMMMKGAMKGDGSLGGGGKAAPSGAGLDVGWKGGELFGKGMGCRSPELSAASSSQKSAAASWFATMGNSKAKSEFGILDVAPPQALLNQKRGLASVELGAGTGQLMTEEQAKEFQRALKKRR